MFVLYLYYIGLNKEYFLFRIFVIWMNEVWLWLICAKYDLNLYYIMFELNLINLKN